MEVAIFIAAAILLCLGVTLLLGRRSYKREREAKAAGSFALSFVWVNDDGSVRELDAEERSYLNTEFHPTDGARPYFKSKYETKTPDGRMSGFLNRDNVPKRLSVRE